MIKRWLVFVFYLYAWPVAGQVNEFRWLIGSWHNEEANSFEVWTEKNGKLSGVGYEKATTGKKNVTETIRIVKKKSDFFYVPDVAGKQGPVYFKITERDNQSFVAENPEHDFPQRIIYKRMDDDHFQALVMGGGKTLKFFFTKVKS